MDDYEIFNFPTHRFRYEYQINSGIVKFGNAYESATKPNAPPQRIFTLSMIGFRWVTNASGKAVNRTRMPTVNIAYLEDFYRRQQLFGKFYYPLPTEGNILVRFKDALKLPYVEGNTGVLPEFELSLLEQF